MRRIDFDEVTKLFTDIRPLVANLTDVREFVGIVQMNTTEKILAYFECPEYDPSDLELLVQHVMDCINNITPEAIPYRSVSINGQWTMVKKSKNDPPQVKPS